MVTAVTTEDFAAELVEGVETFALKREPLREGIRSNSADMSMTPESG